MAPHVLEPCQDTLTLCVRFGLPLERRDLFAQRRERGEPAPDRLERLSGGIDQDHASLLRFNTPRGWLSLVWATLLSAPSHANKLLAGYVALRAIGVEANFVDVLLLQTLITFLLYFAPTPGASGIAELLSAAVMAAGYVPRTSLPLYTLLWRLTLSYYTLAFGFLVFSNWVRKGLRSIDADGTAALGAT
jgi:uncharacterized protein (TIRG00374 family)